MAKKATFKFPKRKPRSRDKKGILSDPISRATATTALNNYQNHPQRLTIMVGGAPVTLSGVRFDREDIEELLKPDTVSHIQLLFAQCPTDPTCLTIIAGSVTASPVTSGGTINLDKLYDFCEPCPSKCPSNLPTLASRAKKTNRKLSGLKTPLKKKR